MQKQQLVAVDTNIALCLADGDELAVDALQLIGRKLHPVKILAPPTVVAELVYQSKFDAEMSRRQSASTALGKFDKFKISPVPMNSVQEAIVIKAADGIRHSGMLPPAECNDAFVLAEAATLNCVLLVSNDSHLLDIDPRQLGLFFRELDLSVPIIVSPRELIHKFYPK